MESVSDLGRLLAASELPLLDAMPSIMSYFQKGSIGLHHLPSNMEVYRLTHKYMEGKATDNDLSRLHTHFKYRVRQDSIAEEVLSSLHIPRTCGILQFFSPAHRRPGASPYFDALCSVSLFEDPPSLRPRVHHYNKPLWYVAWSAHTIGMDISSFKSGLDYFVTHKAAPSSGLEILAAEVSDPAIKAELCSPDLPHKPDGMVVSREFHRDIT